MVIIGIGDNTRGSSPGAERFQEETWLCSGDIRRLAWGKILASDWESSSNVSLAVVSVMEPLSVPWKTLHVKWNLSWPDKNMRCLELLTSFFLSGLSEILWIWVYGACMSMSCCGLLPMHPNSESSDSPATAGAHRQTYLRSRWDENTTAFDYLRSLFGFCCFVFFKIISLVLVVWAVIKYHIWMNSFLFSLYVANTTQKFDLPFFLNDMNLR